MEQSRDQALLEGMRKLEIAHTAAGTTISAGTKALQHHLHPTGGVSMLGQRKSARPCLPPSTRCSSNSISLLHPPSRSTLRFLDEALPSDRLIVITIRRPPHPFPCLPVSTQPSPFANLIYLSTNLPTSKRGDPAAPYGSVVR